MRTDHILVVLQSLCAVAGVGLVTSLVAHGMPELSALTGAVPTSIALAAALAVLGFFNVWLPRGDTFDTTAPIAFAAGVMLHPLLAVGVLILARSTTVIAKPHGQTLWAFTEYVGRRALLVSLVFAVLGPGFADSLRLPGSSQLPLLVAASAVGFVLFDMLLEQLHVSVRSHAPFRGILLGAARLQGWMIAAEMSVAVLSVLLFRPIQYWGLAVTVGLLLVMRQSFALLFEVRASYTSTVEVLARSIEAYDPSRRGHAERVARMVGEAGRAMGLQGKRLEDLTYAALFHDVGLLGADGQEEISTLKSSVVLSNVGFLAGAVPILGILDSAADDDASLDENDLVGAYMIAHFSALDSELLLGGSENYELARSVGVRLYTTTRRRVDRALRRVERGARTGTVKQGDLVDVTG